MARGDAVIWGAMLGLFMVAIFIPPFIALVPVFAWPSAGAGASAASMLISMQGLGRCWPGAFLWGPVREMGA